MTCPGCAPHPPHAGRCPRYDAPAPGRLVECRCQHHSLPPAELCATNHWEKAHGIPVHSDHAAGAGVAGLPMDRAEAQRQLTACGTELSDIAADLLSQIGAIGQTMTAEAARLRGEGA